ncbi:hypothetical protein KUCAC02_009108 [Chaenocephalus aceratus]|uniref:Uncharacterized protein n=1 Tax=Chaenocephalus aceratus TaxID=36190 RepID=A0ACB9WT90_CHAAC|nr:hypothetical protein KUCAC02_009108 [Chaenocephalus aceratus]
MEAQYHPICRNNFNNDYQNHERGRKRGKKAADNIDSPQARKMAAHDKSYCVVKDYILRNVVEHKEVVQLRSMCNLYRKTLEGEGFPNPEYRSEKLARRLQGDKDISRELTFSKQLTASGNSQSTSSCVPHLYRSKQLTTILSRLGHSETYDFSMELETAMAKAFDEMSTNLTPQIITGEGNTVFHSEWDNLNRITTNVHGSDVVNSTGGIMIQEVKESHRAESEEHAALDKVTDYANNNLSVGEVNGEYEHEDEELEMEEIELEDLFSDDEDDE